MVNRIRELLETRQLSPTQFADLIGVGRPVVSHILSERNKPSLEVVQKILDAFPDVSLSWLMKGIGSMRADVAPASAVAATPAAAPMPVPLSPFPTAPVETVAELLTTPVVAPPPATHSAALQPQAFSHTVSGATHPASMATPAPRPLPPKFRPARATASSPAATSPLPTTEPIATAPLAAPAPATPTSPAPTATFIAAPSPTPQPAPTFLPEAGPAPEYQPASLATPAPPAISQAPLASAVTGAPPAAAWAPPVAEVPVAAPTAEVPITTPNPAAALSFLGEPGKAIRRIVIFYRDGSFSDYVPEGY